MGMRTIVREGDEILRKTCRAVDKFDNRLFTLLDDMAQTMKSANGVGLAAPQVATLKRVVIIDVGDGIIELINPEIIYESAHCEEETEGCLSSPGEYGLVPRPKKVVAKYFDRTGKPCEVTGEGLLARAICHEVDHLNGILFKDKASSMVDPEDD